MPLHLISQALYIRPSEGGDLKAKDNGYKISEEKQQYMSEVVYENTALNS